MIDIENDLFNSVATELRSQFRGIKVYGEEIFTPSSFPCVTFIEADNYPLLRTSDSGSLENHSKLMYEVNVYSNKSNGKKAECKQILSVIDRVLSNKGFMRIGKAPYSLNDATIYRLISRYSAIVSKTNIIYGG